MKIENFKDQKTAEECVEKMRQGIVIQEDEALTSLRTVPDINGVVTEFVYKEYTDNGYVSLERVAEWIRRKNQELPYCHLSVDEAYDELDAGHAVYDGTNILTTAWMRRNTSEPEARWVLYQYEGVGIRSIMCELSKFMEHYAASKDLRRWPDNEE